MDAATFISHYLNVNCDMNKVLVLVFVITTICGTNGSELSQSFQIFGKIVRQFLNTQPEDLKISDGVHLVNIKSEHDARGAVNDKTVFDAFENYLQTHQLRIYLPELMPGEEFGREFKSALEDFDYKDEGSPRKSGGGGGGGKGGMGGILVMGLMMGKMMAALGIGGVGLLAMKALMVSALALMLSLVIGLKKLVHSGHDDSGHTVIHASHGHGHEYRRKRDAVNMAYKAWSSYT